MTALERRSVAALSLLYIFRMLGLFMVLPLLALYAADMPGATPTLIGFALGAYGLTQALLQLPLGWLSDQVGRKPVIYGGLLVFALGSVVAALADSVQGVVFGRALQGAGAIASTVMALVADLTREEQRTKAMAMVGIGIGLSFALALVLGPAVAAFGGLPAVFWSNAGLACAGMVVLALLVPPPPPAVRHAEVGANWKLVGRCLAEPELLRLNFGVFALHFILMGCFLVAPGYLEDIAGVHRDQHWRVYLPVVLLSLAGVVPLMIAAERRGRARLAFLVGVIAVGAASALLGLSTTAPALFALLWLFFVGFNYLEATLPSLVSKAVFSGGKGTAMGVYSTCQFLGAFVGGAGGGWTLEHLGKGALAASCGLLAIAWGWTVVRAPFVAARPDTVPGL